MEEVHNGKVADVKLYIKNNLDLPNAKTLLEDTFPGIVRRKLECIEKLTDKIDKTGWSFWIFRKVKNIASIYVDMSKDMLLMVTILIIIGGPTSLYYFPTKLTTGVVLCLFGTIILPLICTSLLHTEEEIEMEKDLSLSRRLLKYLTSLIISPIRPLLLSIANDENKAEKKNKILYEKYRDDVLKLNKNGETTRRNYARFIRIDLGLQVFFQLSGQIIYLLLSSTNSPTTGGLEQMFKKTSDALLALSVAISIRKVFNC